MSDHAVEMICITFVLVSLFYILVSNLESFVMSERKWTINEIYVALAESAAAGLWQYRWTDVSKALNALPEREASPAEPPPNAPPDESEQFKHDARKLAELCLKKVDGPGCNPMIQTNARDYAERILAFGALKPTNENAELKAMLEKKRQQQQGSEQHGTK